MLASGWVVAPLLPLLLTLEGIWLAPERINHDCAAYLQYGGLLLGGKLPYVDFVDTNPPLIIYLSAIPAFLARHCPLNAIIVFSLCVLGLVAWSTFAILRQLLRGSPLWGGCGAGMLALLWAAFSLFVWRCMEFGQREHLFLLLYMPFLMARWARWVGEDLPVRQALRVGIAAGIGMCLKPYFVLSALVPELHMIVSTRQRPAIATPEVVGCGCVGVLYVMHFLFLPAAMRDSFFHRWLPLIMAHYSAYDTPLRSMVHVPIAVAGLTSLLVLLPDWTRTQPSPTLSGALAAFTLASVGMYFLQHKGWFYHEIPALGGLALLLGVVGLRCLDTVLVQRKRRYGEFLERGSLVLCCGVALTGASLVRSAAAHRRPPPGAGFDAVILRYTNVGEPVLFVSTSVSPAYPALVRTNRLPAWRYAMAFPIAFGIAARWMDSPAPDAAAASPPEERQFLQELAGDVSVSRPPLAFIDASPNCQACPANFNILAYLEDIGFMQGSLAGYTRVGSVEGFAIFVRRDRLQEANAQPLSLLRARRAAYG